MTFSAGICRSGDQQHRSSNSSEYQKKSRIYFPVPRGLSVALNVILLGCGGGGGGVAVGPRQLAAGAGPRILADEASVHAVRVSAASVGFNSGDLISSIELETPERKHECRFANYLLLTITLNIPVFTAGSTAAQVSAHQPTEYFTHLSTIARSTLYTVETQGILRKNRGYRIQQNCYCDCFW